MEKENKNYAFIDGQNLYMGTTKKEVNPWKIVFPDGERASSLYKKLGSIYFASLDDKDTKRKIEMKKAP